MDAPSPHATTTTQFNQVIQYDLVSIEEAVIVHVIDVTIKWSMARVVPNRETATVLGCVTEHWFAMFGPPDVIEGDQEGALAGNESGVRAARWGTSRKLRPWDGHAGVIERHNELLRKQ